MLPSDDVARKRYDGSPPRSIQVDKMVRSPLLPKEPRRASSCAQHHDARAQWASCSVHLQARVLGRLRGLEALSHGSWVLGFGSWAWRGVGRAARRPDCQRPRGAWGQGWREPRQSMLAGREGGGSSSPLAGERTRAAPRTPCFRDSLRDPTLWSGAPSGRCWGSRDAREGERGWPRPRGKRPP